MAGGTFDSEFFKEWENLLNEDQPTMSLRKKSKQSSKPPSRLEGETEEQRERRLKLARDCSSRRRSIESPEQREKRLYDQRTRMAQMRKNETEEERQERYVYVCICVRFFLFIDLVEVLGLSFCIIVCTCAFTG